MPKIVTARKKGRSFRLNEANLAMFERLYPEILTLFLDRAILCAISDRKFFDLVFFTPLLQEVSQ